MSKACSGFQIPSGKSQIHKLTMALQNVGHGYSGEISYSARKKIFLLVVTDYFSKWVEEKSTQPNNRPSDPKVSVDQCDHPLWGSRRDCHRQRSTVHKPQFQGVLQRLGHKAHLRHTSTPSVQHTSRVHEQDCG